MLVWVRVRVRVELWTNYGRCGGYIVAVGVINEIVETRATKAALLLLRAVLASTRTCRVLKTARIGRGGGRSEYGINQSGF